MSNKKPHIIIFNPDEMRWDGMGHMGTAAAHTPHLDHFAREEAVSFSHAYCQNPVCVPSRCSFLTGRYPHVSGHRTMRYLLREGERTLFQELLDNGYYVWMNGRNDLVAGQIPELAESHASEIYEYDPSEDTEGSKRKQQQRTLMGKHHGYPYAHYLGVTDFEYGNDSKDLQAAINRVRNAPKNQPLCMFLGLVNPHPPYCVEKKYYERIPEAFVPERIHASDTSGKCRMMEKIREYSGMEDFPQKLWLDMRRVYLAQCAMIDDMFGQLCDALKESGMYDDSVIFVLSDHGDFAGDYDLPEKAQNCFEDCLTRVPLLIKPPKGQLVDCGITDSIVELVDFYATALDYAGVEPACDHFGRSLRPIIENRTQTVRQYAFCEGGRLAHETQCDEFHSDGLSLKGTSPQNEYLERMDAQCDDLAHEKGTMICDGRYKYIERPSGANEFYDLEKDPGERKNLYVELRDTPMVIRFQRELLRWYQTTCDVVPRNYDGRFTEAHFWIMIKQICPPEREDEVRGMFRKGASMLDVMQYFMKLAHRVADGTAAR